MILLLATLTPFQPDVVPAKIAARFMGALHPSFEGRDVVDGARNLVLFAGWGVIWTLTALGPVRRIAIRATLTGAAISAAVEAAQLFSSNRFASLLDVTTNTAGSLAGALVLLGLVALVTQRRTARSFVGMPAALFAGGYGLATFLEAFTPLFRQDTVPGASGWPTARFAAAIAAFRLGSIADFTWSDFPIFLPAGAFAVAALVEHGRPYFQSAVRVILFGLGLSVLAELLHGALGQPMLLGAVFSHAVAVGLGAWIAAASLPRLSVEFRGAMRTRALSLAYVAILVAWELRPFVPELSLTEMFSKATGPWYIPLARLGGRVDFFSVVKVCAPFFLYLPLGGLLAVWPWRKRGLLQGPLPGVWLALATEAAQLLVRERLPDITDVLVQASGAIIGWTIKGRAGYRSYGETVWCVVESSRGS